MASQWHTRPVPQSTALHAWKSLTRAQGPMEHDGAGEEAVLGSGQDSCRCRHLRSRSTRL